MPSFSAPGAVAIALWASTCWQLASSEATLLSRGRSKAHDPSTRTHAFDAKRDCRLLQTGIVVKPQATCKALALAGGWSGCACHIRLPPNLHPMPDTFYDPWGSMLAKDPHIPTLPPLPTLPPPSNPLQPYVPPPLAPECPYSTRCDSAEDFGCIGFNSWGFQEVRMEAVTPAAMYFNTISCSYLMEANSTFHVPKRMRAWWRMNDKRLEVKKIQEVSLDPACQASHGATLEDFCGHAASVQRRPCKQTWEEAVAGSCDGALAPGNFQVTSTLWELCPLECEANVRLHAYYDEEQ